MNIISIYCAYIVYKKIHWKAQPKLDFNIYKCLSSFQNRAPYTLLSLSSLLHFSL